MKQLLLQTKSTKNKLKYSEKNMARQAKDISHEKVELRK